MWQLSPFFFSFQKCKFFLGNSEHTKSYTIPKLYTLYPSQTGNGCSTSTFIPSPPNPPLHSSYYSPSDSQGLWVMLVVDVRCFLVRLIPCHWWLQFAGGGLYLVVGGLRSWAEVMIASRGLSAANVHGWGSSCIIGDLSLSFGVGVCFSALAFVIRCWLLSLGATLHLWASLWLWVV